MTDSAPSGTGSFSLRERWLGIRDRLLASPRFHRFAARIPGVRSLARKRAGALFDLCAGFVYSQVLFATVESGLIDELSKGPQSEEALSRRLELSPDATLRLLNAAISLRLVTRRDGGMYGLGELGAALNGAPGVTDMVRHHSLLYRDLVDPLALLRGQGRPTELESYWAYVAREDASAVGDAISAPYSELMAASQPFVAEEVLNAYPIDRHRHVLDVGGGTGAFLRCVAERAPDIEMTLFDLPSVAEQAKVVFEQHGLSARAKSFGGSFFDDPLPRGADLITLIRVLYDHPDEAALKILRGVRDALPAGGTLLLAEPMAGTRNAEASGDAYFGFYLLAMNGGRPRSDEDFAELLKRAGFAEIRPLRTNRPLFARAIVARA